MTSLRPHDIRQPGPALPERIIAVPARCQTVTLDLQAGCNLLDGLRQAFAEAGFAGGMVDLEGLALGPFGYVMPALSKTGENAAFYSETFCPEGITRIKSGKMTCGRRDGAPFFHAHALWREADGRMNGGHILPDQTIVAVPICLAGFGLDGAMFEAELDPETNFRLFGPVSAPLLRNDRGVEAIALRLRPNQDFCGAIEFFCQNNGIQRANIMGGVGSLIGARFTDGREITNFATEIFIQEGSIAPGPGNTPVATIVVGLVDYTGQLAEGILQRGDNPVLMTFELALEITERA